MPRLGKDTSEKNKTSVQEKAAPVEIGKEKTQEGCAPQELQARHRAGLVRATKTQAGSNDLQSTGLLLPELAKATRNA